MARYVFKEPIYDKSTYEVIREDDIQIDKRKLENRLVSLDGKNLREIRQFPRFKTGLAGFDDVTGGLPYALTIFLGDGGTGKSKLCKAIAERNKSLYICAETLMDKPSGKATVADYVRYQPRPEMAVRQLFGLITMLEPDIVFIDSLTIFLSGTKAAVMEADVRENVFRIASMCEGQIPIVGISEMRGKGQYKEPAGGKGIIHAGALLVDFDKVLVDHWNTTRLKEPEDSFIWTMAIMKDRQGQSQQSKIMRVMYDDAGIPSFTSMNGEP